MRCGAGVSALSARGLIRFDVEDYLTPESDDALEFMLAAMQRAGLPGSYGLVGYKVEALLSRGRQTLLSQLADQAAVGFHSLSHSAHPTIAEELAGLTYDQAVSRFIEREGPGARLVAEHIRAPQYFTQPGGNWVPEAAEALPELGIPVYFTDSFNSYVVDLPGPFWYGRVLLYSFPVVNPRPFGLGLPYNLSEAIALIEARQGQPEPFMVMLHPTELVTREFWDAVNFSQGSTRAQLVPAPVRSPQEQIAALESFETYLQEIRHLAIEWTDSETLLRTVAPRDPVGVTEPDLIREIGQHGWGPVLGNDGDLSAAEALYGLARFKVGHHDVRIGYVAPPRSWRPESSETPLPESKRMEVCRRLVDFVEHHGALPTAADLDGIPLEAIMASLVPSKPPVAVRFLEYIKTPEALHWDWPIFPDQFKPWRLWHDARRLAWTLKPARPVAG